MTGGPRGALGTGAVSTHVEEGDEIDDVVCRSSGGSPGVGLALGLSRTRGLAMLPKGGSPKPPPSRKHRVCRW